ncbi:hypothetical protein GCM10023184_17810 [Flaviaesturariibacter amylovorans]|uniref:Uncharacterized protein n=1 Tax=Flaviaesturariibacter amylovorans TaxID=1084520 RepID=A0ABP8GPU4_9BACT
MDSNLNPGRIQTCDPAEGAQKSPALVRATPLRSLVVPGDQPGRTRNSSGAKVERVWKDLFGHRLEHLRDWNTDRGDLCPSPESN